MEQAVLYFTKSRRGKHNENLSAVRTEADEPMALFK
jgi:hypothetical protein